MSRQPALSARDRSGLPMLVRMALAAVCAALTAACGATQYQAALLEFLDETPSRRGLDWCQARSLDQASDAALRRYLPQELTAHRWPGRAPGGAPLPEASFFAALDQGRLPRTLLVAGAGMGKSRLADAIDAELCATMPTLRLRADAHLLGLLRAGHPDPMQAQVEFSLGLAQDAAGQERLRELLGKSRWVLLIDALHEVPPSERPGFLRHLRAYLDRHPKHLQAVVFARPDAVRSDLGLGEFDAVLAIPRLTCDRSDLVLRGVTRGAEREARLRAFFVRSGLADRVTVDNTCYYEHLDNYRGIRVAIEVAEALGVHAGDGQTALWPARTQIYARFLQRHVEATLGLAPAAAVAVLAAAEGHVARFGPGALLSAETCAASSGAHHAEVCPQLLRSPLMAETAAEAAPWANAPVAAWLGARLLAKNVVGDKGCEPIVALAAAPEQERTLAFALGETTAAPCVAAVADALCTRMGTSAAVTALLDPALPAGPARAAHLRAWSAPAAGCAGEVRAQLAGAAGR